MLRHGSAKTCRRSPAVLLRESFREGAKVRTCTLANLTHWPDAKVEALKRVLRGETLVTPADRFEIERALPHAHVAAVLGTVRALLSRRFAGPPRRDLRGPSAA